MLDTMNTLTGLRLADPGLSSVSIGALGTAAAPSASGASGTRWLDGLDGPAPGVLAVEPLAGGVGLDAAAHAQRVLAQLIDAG